MSDCSELKACPFCGGTVKIEEGWQNRRKWYGIYCRNTSNRGGSCAYETHPSASKEAAIERWNMRVPYDQLKAENEKARMRIKELDLLFGRYILAMRSALIEEEHGKGPSAAMEWIYNSLVGPGQLPPEGETASQAYFDREIVAVDKGMDEVMEFYRQQQASKQVKQ